MLYLNDKQVLTVEELRTLIAMLPGGLPVVIDGGNSDWLVQSAEVAGADVPSKDKKAYIAMDALILRVQGGD